MEAVFEEDVEYVCDFEEGKIASYHLYFDQAGFLSQLGITPGT